MRIETPPAKSAILQKRTLKVVCGFVLLLVGGVLAIPAIPGPGIPIVLLGLWLLSDRFLWAGRAFAWVKEKADWFRRTGGGEERVAAQMVGKVPTQK